MGSNAPFAFAAALRPALATRVNADASFPGVSVVIVPEGGAALEEAVILIRPPDGKVTGTQEWAASGRLRRNETFIMPGRLWVRATGPADTTSTTFVAAGNRAAALLDHVIQICRDEASTTLNVGDQTIDAHVSSYEYQPVRIESGWVVYCDFDITVRVRIP